MPRCWTERFTKFISNLKFNQSNADPCFYFYTEDDKLILMTKYVDDGLVVASDECIIDKFKSDLNKEFKITSTKEVKSFLPLEINRLQDGSIFIHQSRYIERILEKIKMNA